MKKIALITACSAALAAALNAQTVTTDPVGFVSITVPAASDAAIGAPLGRATEYQGVIQSISGTTITVAGTPGWTASQFVYAAGTQPKTYFARIDSGLKEGLICTVSANGTGDLTVTLPSGENLTNVSTNAVPVSPATTGDSISIAPYWTPATLITGVVTGTNILRYPTTTPGINLSSSATYVFSGTEWLQSGNPVNDVPFGPTEGFVLRNNSASPQTITITGSVPMTAFRRALYTLAANTRQDQRFFYNSPVPELVGNAFPPSALVIGDNILVYNNDASGKNKSSSATLIWNGSQWLQSGNDVTSTYQLTPGWSYVFRKAQTGASPASVVWSDLQSYLQ